MTLQSAEYFMRFWSKVIAHQDCWLWQGSKDKDGYGLVGIGNGKIRGAHRVSFYLQNGKIPFGLQVLHKCDVPACVRPDHLFLGTHSDNMQDKLAKGRDQNQKKTHCKPGHPFSGDNLRMLYGKRVCRTCKRLSMRKRR